MKIIEKLSEKIAEEISDAREYAQMALENRDEFPNLARTLYDLSEEELGHMSRLHDAVAAIIKKYREEKGAPPADMLAVYNYLHKQWIGKTAEVKTLQAMFNR